MMRFTIAIYADGSDELKAALAGIADAIPPSAFTGKSRGFMINVEPEYRGGTCDETAPVSAPPAKDPEETAAPEAASATRTPRKAAAPATPRKAKTPEPDVKADAEPAAETSGLTPKEAKEQALDILRECFELEHKPGDAAGATAVKALQTEMGVAKFVQVPDERGIELLEKAQKLRARFGAPTTAEPPADDDPIGDVADTASDVETETESADEMGF